MKIIIDGKQCSFEQGESVLTVARKHDIEIPSICSASHMKPNVSCGLCVVKNHETNTYIKSCCLMAKDGLEVTTNDDHIKEERAKMMQIIVDKHKYECASCFKLPKCEILKTAAALGVKKDFQKAIPDKGFDLKYTDKYITIDVDKCIACGKCASACTNFTTTGALTSTKKPNEHGIVDIKLIFDEARCIACGQCVAVCPVDAIREDSELEKVEAALADPKKVVVIGSAPAARVILGEAFGQPYGTNVEGKMYTAMRQLGFDRIFDINNAADITILEEGTELVKRISKGGPFPMFTSCCPGWQSVVYKHKPELTEYLSTTKSPQGIYGALTKTYFPKMEGIDPKDVFSVTLMPCTAKRPEKENKELFQGDIQETDAVITVKDFAKMIKKAKINFMELEDGKVDPLLGHYTGTGALFGQTGGVMETALRFAVQEVDNRALELEFKPVRGLEAVKEADLTLGGKPYKIAVINGVKNFEIFAEKNMKEHDYLFVEVMTCHGGCIFGGGQPAISSMDTAKLNDIKLARVKGLQDIDKGLKEHVATENPQVQKLYKEFLGKPYVGLSHDLLHVDQSKASSHIDKVK